MPTNASDLAAQAEDLLRAARRHLRRGTNRALQAVAPPRNLPSYLRTHPVAKLHIGCGGRLLDGWFNTDRDPPRGGAYLDVTRRFPLEDATFHYVFAEHVIEHLTWEQGGAMLRECRRVLRPGGRIRIGTPDLPRIVGLLDDRAEGAERYLRWCIDAFLPAADAYRPAFVINNAFRAWGHRFLYDEETLGASLEAAGFRRVRRVAYGHSDDPALAGIDARPDATTEEMRGFETLILEAERP